VQNGVPNASAPPLNRNTAAAGGGDRPNRGTAPTRAGGYRVGGGTSQASKQNDTNERFMSQPPRAVPAPRGESGDGTAAPRYRIPTAPERQPQNATPSPQREYRGTGSASRYAAPEARSAPPPRAENSAAAPSRGEVRSAPRNEGGSARGGGGERAPQHQGGGHGGGRGDGRDGESHSRER
jgi:hypothetical protein